MLCKAVTYSMLNLSEITSQNKGSFIFSLLRNRVDTCSHCNVIHLPVFCFFL